MHAIRLMLAAALGAALFASDAAAGDSSVRQVAVAVVANPAVSDKTAKKAPVHNPIVHKTLMRSVSVPMDNVALVSFKTPVSTVYVGNPSIAELTMVDSQHVFVLGKRFGATNLIVLGEDKQLIENDPITVSSRQGDAVTVFRGDETYNYSCTGYHCETRPVPGDPGTYFQNTEGAANAHDATAKAAAAGSSSAEQGH